MTQAVEQMPRMCETLGWTCGTVCPSTTVPSTTWVAPSIKLSCLPGQALPGVTWPPSTSI